LKNIIVAGDSFCACDAGWPGMLANKLELNLVSYGQGGEHWWGLRNFLKSLDTETLNHTSTVVLVHTNADRIPNTNKELGRVNISNTNPQTDLEKSVYYYYKYIHDSEFLNWAQEAWFKEIAGMFAGKKILHLHSFPWSMPLSNLLTGTTVSPSLMSISLNEIGAKTIELFDDARLNHLNHQNNHALTQQLYDLIQNYQTGPAQLKLDQFEQTSNHWIN
jgi:hypothetical protein